MPWKLSFRQLTVAVLAMVRDLNDKEIGARSGYEQKNVSQLLRSRDLNDEHYEKLLAAVEATPAAVTLTTGYLESLEALEKDDRLTGEERALIEQGLLEVSRLWREALTELVLLSRNVPAGGYPAPAEVEPARRRAEELWAILKKTEAGMRPVVVRCGREFQSWALCERACKASVREVSRNLEKAAEWAQLAQQIAELVPGPEGWRNRNRGHAKGHIANVLRVGGELKPSRAVMEEAKRWWSSGSDPDNVLDPGRLLDLDASLCIEERGFDRALALLDDAAAVGHHPERYQILKGVRLEKMGDYEGAVSSYLRALPRVDRQSEPRQWSILHFNFSVCASHLGHYHEAANRLEEVHLFFAEMGDEIALTRCTWLRGRIAAGLGRVIEAQSLLEHARREFQRWKMSYDVAQCLLEESAMLLDQGRSNEVKALAEELTSVFASKGVHREALAALRLFSEAAERETATAELARCILSYLFRARDDEGLRFTAS